MNTLVRQKQHARARVSGFFAFVIITLLATGALFADVAGAQTDSGAAAGAAENAAPRSDVTARLVVEPQARTVGDPTTILLEVVHPLDTQVLPPELSTTWEGLEVRSQGPVSTVENGDGILTTSQTIEVVSFAPGEVVTPPLTVSVSDAAGQVSRVTAAPVTLMIDSVLIEGDEELRDIKPQAELTVPSLLPYQIGGGVLALVLLVGLVWWLFRRYARRPLIDNRPPYQVAFDELDRVATLNLVQTQEFKQYYSQVTDVVRTYIERTYRVPTMDRTTVEIERGLKMSAMDSGLIQAYVDLFTDSDLVKFADVMPSTDAAEKLLPAARMLIQRSRDEIAAAAAAAATATATPAASGA